MNFYKRFVADIQVKTGHLTPAEFGIYDRLLDHYYATEQPLPALERCCAIARAMSRADRSAVERVLGEFFTLRAGGYYQGRADEMIAEAQPKIAAARLNGKGGGRPRKNPKSASAKPTGLILETQQGENAKASQSQSTSIEVRPPSGVPGAKASKRCPKDFQVEPEVWSSMQDECPGVSIARETQKFRDWEFTKARSDWPAAWRIWMRKAFDDLPTKTNGKSFKERDSDAAAERVREMTGGLLDARRDPSNTIEMEMPRAAQIGNR